ncbi:MAG: hypothetical protein R2753_11130 [Chitinophagales bacterium]
MRIKKIRGHRRRWKAIDDWVAAYKVLDMDYLKSRQRDYAKIRVHPWSSISMLNSEISSPKGATKRRILNGLIEIYDAWKNELDQLGAPYYLKIWLYEPRFINAQVVCAIGDCLDFYTNTFFKPDDSKKFNPKIYGPLEEEVSKFKWEYRLDEDHFDNETVGSPEMYETMKDYKSHKNWFEKKLTKPHRLMKLEEPIGEINEYYSFKRGAVWLGEK